MINLSQNNTDIHQELKRKSFHLLGLIYPLTLRWVGLTEFRILLIVFWVAVALMEIARLSTPAFNGFVFEHFGDLFREKERSRQTGVFWMMSGALFSAFMLDTPALVATVLLYVVFGDLTASLVGKWLGGPRWFKSEKRLSGSFACFLVCVAVGFLLLRSEYAWHLILLGALVATLAEAEFIHLDDNFSIPVASTILFWFAIPIP